MTAEASGGLSASVGLVANRPVAYVWLCVFAGQGGGQSPGMGLFHGSFHATEQPPPPPPAAHMG